MKIVEEVDFGTLNVCTTMVDARRALCPADCVVELNPESAHIYEELSDLYRGLYFEFGKPDSPAVSVGRVLSTSR
jgi:hypothetical protein